MGQWNTRSYLGKTQRSHDLPKPPKYRKTREKYRNTCERHLLKLASVAQLDAPSDWRPGGRGFNPRRGRQHSFVEIDHEIFSTVILSLSLIQEGQLSVSGERMCTILRGVVGWCEGAVYLTSLGRPTDIGLQLGKACYPCSG